MEPATLTTPAVEVWHPVVGYEGLYEVSNKGVVRSLNRFIDKMRRDGIPYRKTIKGQIIKTYKDKKGYVIAPLIKDRVRHSVLLHRIIAEAFIPNPESLPCINHKDENKSNNSIHNLEWCSYLYNTQYGTGQKRKGESRRRPFEQLTMEGVHVATFQRRIDCPFDTRGIHGALIGKRKSAYGYQWRYVDN